MSRSVLYKELLQNRNEIWTEILVNLNAIIKLMKNKIHWNPSGIFRIADWELFGRKIHSKENQSYFISLLKKMNKEKNKFGLEDDLLYILLRQIVVEERREINDESASDLYTILEEKAESTKIKDFHRRYKSPRSMAKRLANIKEELSEEFYIEILEERSRVKKYSFKAKCEEKW